MLHSPCLLVEELAQDLLKVSVHVAEGSYVGADILRNPPAETVLKAVVGQVSHIFFRLSLQRLFQYVSIGIRFGHHY